jgi:hypothetical protein
MLFGVWNIRTYLGIRLENSTWGNIVGGVCQSSLPGTRRNGARGAGASVGWALGSTVQA